MLETKDIIVNYIQVGSTLGIIGGIVIWFSSWATGHLIRLFKSISK